MSKDRGEAAAFMLRHVSPWLQLTNENQSEM